MSLPAALLLLAIGPAAASSSGRYAKIEIQGWTLRVHAALLSRKPERKAAFEKMMAKLDAELRETASVLPPETLPVLRQTTLWAVDDPSIQSGSSVNVSRKGMLRINDEFEAAMAGGIVLVNPKYFKDHSYRMLHLLVRAFHEQLPENRKTEIEAAYAQAMAQELYPALRAPSAATKEWPPTGANAANYFAELSQAYFSSSTRCPRTRAELLLHDPRSLRMIESVWGVQEAYASDRAAGSPCSDPAPVP